MKRWEVFACKRLPVLLGILFLFCAARDSFAAEIKVGLYNADDNNKQFTSTATSVYPWFADTTAKELIHIKLGVKPASGSVTIYSINLTLNFDKDYFEVTNSDGTKVDKLTGLSPYFPIGVGDPCSEFDNSVDYVNGVISYSAWWPDPIGCYYNAGLTPLTATTSAPAFLVEFYLKPLKGTNGSEKNVKIDIDNDNTIVEDSNHVYYKKSDAAFKLSTEANHGAAGYKFKIKPVPPSLAAPVETTNAKVTLTWTPSAIDTSGTKYYVYRAKTTASGAPEPTSYSTTPIAKDLQTTTYEDTTVNWDGQFTKYWYKVTVKDTASTPNESCAASAYSQCVAQGITDTLDPTLQSFDVSSTVYSQIKIAATLDEPGFIQAEYSCASCTTPITNKQTAYQPTSASKTPSVALSSSGLTPTPDFVAADEGKTVTYKIKAKDAAGHELAFSTDKTFTITTCTETAPPSIANPTSSISSCAESKMQIKWDTGAFMSDSTVYYTKIAGISNLKTKYNEEETANQTHTVFKCNEPLYVKSTDHSVILPCGTDTIDAGTQYYYQVCSTNCFNENCSGSTNTFTFDVNMALTHSCPVTQGSPGNAYPLTATLSGGCSPTVNVFYAADTTTLKDSAKTVSMTASGSNYSASIPSSDVAPPEFFYYIKADDSSQPSAVQPPGADTDTTKACKVTVPDEPLLCPTMTLTCNDKTVQLGNDAEVNFTLTGGTETYQCDLYFGTVETVVTTKLNTKAVSSAGDYTDTILASNIPEAKKYYFQGKCTDFCTPTAVQATSTVCTLTVSDAPVTTAIVKGTVKAGDTNLPLAAATVKIINASTNNEKGSTTTGSDGTFSFAGIDVTSGSPAYRLVITATGYSTTTVNINTVSAPETNVGEILLAKTTKIYGKCTDSKSGEAVSDLTIIIKSLSTGQSFDTKTNTSGDYSKEDLQTGTYSVDVYVKGTIYKEPETQNITVPPDGKADFSLDPSPITTVTIKPSSKSIGLNETVQFYVDTVLASSGAALKKTPVEWDVSKLTSLGEVSYSDGNKSILIFKSSTEGTALVTVTKVGGADVPATAVSAATLTVTQTLSVTEISFLTPVTSGTKIPPAVNMKKPVTKDTGVIMQADVSHSGASVTYKVYNLQGRLIKVINGTLNSTTQKLEATWNCTDSSESRVPNGIYIVQAEASEGGQTVHAGKPKAITCMW